MSSGKPALIADLAARARLMVALVHDLAMRSVRGRLAKLLLEQAKSSQTGIVQRLLTQEATAQRMPVDARYGTPQGVMRMSDAVSGLVEASTNRGWTPSPLGQP